MGASPITVTMMLTEKSTVQTQKDKKKRKTAILLLNAGSATRQDTPRLMQNLKCSKQTLDLEEPGIKFQIPKQQNLRPN